MKFENGYVFRRLDERAKGIYRIWACRKAWFRVNAPNVFNDKLFWVLGKIKDAGMAKHSSVCCRGMLKHMGRDGLVDCGR